MQVAGAEPIAISSTAVDRKKYVKYGTCVVAVIIIMIVVGLSVGLTKRLTPTERSIQKAC